MSTSDSPPPSVVIVGGGFAGVGCAKQLADHGATVTLLDRNNYHQFQPLLYQVATAELSTSDIARPLRAIFRKEPTVAVKQLAVTAVDPGSRTVTTADGQTFTGDYLVVAAGSRPNFFNTPGAQEHSFPLYTVNDAKALRNRIFEVFEAADADPSHARRRCAQLRHRRGRTDRRRDGRRPGRSPQPGHAGPIPRPRRQAGPHLRRRPWPGRPGRLLRQGARLRRRPAGAQRSHPEAGDGCHRDHAGERHPQRRRARSGPGPSSGRAACRPPSWPAGSGSRRGGVGA